MKLLRLANPVVVTRTALGVGGAAIGLADTVARRTLQVVVSRVFSDPVPAYVASDLADDPRDDPRGNGVPPGPTVVVAEPHPPEEPPVDVVGQALAAEAAGDLPVTGSGGAHEPRGASREEEHGQVPWRQAEARELDDEVEAGLER